MMTTILTYLVLAGKIIAAFNVAHASGREGWMGPLAVRTDLQGCGVGREIVHSAVEWLMTCAVSGVKQPLLGAGDTRARCDVSRP